MNFQKVKKSITKKLKDMHAFRRMKKKAKKTLDSVHDSLKKNPQPELTNEEARQIDEYWSKFGIVIPDKCWFQWYYGVTGIKDPRFIPQELYFALTIPHYNYRPFVDAYKDKNIFSTLLPEKYFPKTVLKCVKDEFFDNSGNYIAHGDDLARILLEQKEVIVKNAWDTGRGLNVKKYVINNKEDVQELLNTWKGKCFIVQEAVKQHPFFAQFNESSVNIIRVNTWYDKGQVYISTPVLRFGLPGFFTDVCFVEGEETLRLVGITNDGYLKDEIVDYYGRKKDIGTLISDRSERVPAWDKIREILTECAKKLPYFRLIGWDVTVSETGEPVLFEYNISWPSSYGSQMVDGPMWGEQTDNLLAFLKDGKDEDIKKLKAINLK